MNTSLSVTLGLYSYNISYPKVNSNDLLLVAPHARNEWGIVINEVLNLLQNQRVAISDGVTAYLVHSPSLHMSDIQLVCPQGSAVYEDYQLLCGELSHCSLFSGVHARQPISIGIIVHSKLSCWKLPGHQENDTG